MDQAIRMYLRRARANLAELSRRAQLETKREAREIIQDLLEEYAGALLMLQMSLRQHLDIAAMASARPGEVEFICILSPQGTFDYVSCAVTTLGYQPVDLLGTSLFDYIHSDDVELVYKNFTDGFHNPHVPIDLSFRFRSSDGEWVRLEARSQNLSHGTQVDGYVARCRLIPMVPLPI